MSCGFRISQIAALACASHIRRLEAENYRRRSRVEHGIPSRIPRAQFHSEVSNLARVGGSQSGAQSAFDGSQFVVRIGSPYELLAPTRESPKAVTTK